MKTITLITLIFTATLLFGQQASIDDIRLVKVKNTGTFMEGNEAAGYYAFYEVDKKDSKTRLYNIRFFDANMNEIGKKTITGTKYLSLIDGEYNGDNLLLKFIDIKEKKISYKQYSKSGEYLSGKSEEVKLKELQIDPKGNSLVENSTGLIGVEGKGFLTFINKKFKKWGYEIQFIPNTKGEKGWTYRTDENSKNIETPSFLGANDEVALISVIKRPGLMSKKLSYHILGIDVNTGKKLFEKDMSDGKNSIVVTSTFFDKDTDEVTLMGYYYPSSDKAMKGKSLGIMVRQINKKGEYTLSKNLSWGKDISKKLPVSDKGRLDASGFLYFHEMTKTKDGNYHLVAEQYKKAVATGTIVAALAVRALGGTTDVSAIKIVIEDLYVLKFSPEFDLLSTSIFKKHKSNFALAQGYGLVNISRMGVFIDQLGGFDFGYLQHNEKEDLFSVIYTDYDRKEKARNIHIITKMDGEFVSDKIESDSDATRFRLLPSKYGSVALLEYFRKEKRLNFRREDFNY